MEKKWYEKDKGIILLLIFFFPVGLYLVWKKSDWTKRNKVFATVCVALMVGYAQTLPPPPAYSSSNSSHSHTKSCGYCGKSYNAKNGWSSVMRIVQQSPQGSYCSRKCATDFLRSM